MGNARVLGREGWLEGDARDAVFEFYSAER